MATTKNTAQKKVAKTKAPKKVKATKAKAPKKVKATKKVEPKVVEEKVEPKVVEEKVVDDDTVSVSSKKSRRKMDKAGFMEIIDSLIELNDKQIEASRRSEKKVTGVKHLNRISKDLTKLRGYANKLIKEKRATSSNTSSGFLKPVGISKELCKFTGWKEDEMKSRVEVTKFICEYIKSKELQNPKDKREIVPDKKLATLLSYDAKEHGTLKYYMIQTLMKRHFV